jgi:hypothetical protein
MQWSCLFFRWACLCTAAQVGQACFHAIEGQHVTVKPWAASPELHNLLCTVWFSSQRLWEAGWCHQPLRLIVRLLKLVMTARARGAAREATPAKVDVCFVQEAGMQHCGRHNSWGFPAVTHA